MIIFFKSLLFLSLSVLTYCDNPFSTQPIFVSTQLDEKHNYRLPNNTRPLHYNIHLTTNIEQADFDFYGSVEITLEAVENTKNLTIHYRQLTINEVKLIDVETKKEIKFNEPHYDEITEHFVIPVESELVNGTQYLLSIEYNGTLRDDLAGFHKSSYTDDDGNVVRQAGTHFEPHNARHAFPCYDEPSIRTTFDIVITHSNSYHAVCNMPVKSIEAKENGMVATHFERTPKVQTYLIAFVVSDFSSVSFEKTDGILYNLYAKPSAIRDGQGDYGLFTGEKILTNQEKYFQTKFSLPQMSQIAMPNFGAGAMENWGIVIYMQDLLLYDESSENLQEKHDVGHIIGHEFAR
uniref:CSON008207 protein n=1 Tax=Culicoides sonorensis TaxID=179676 RepID=A0A336M3W6_CULSO